MTGALSACGAGESTAGCIAVVEVDGVRYYGEEEPDGHVPTTGVIDGVVPGCNDTGGIADELDGEVEVRVIEGVPTEAAVLYEGMVHLREGARLPPSAGAWDVSYSCAPGDQRLAGKWETVSEPHAPHFDGVLDPPYTVGIRVDRGPSRLVDQLVDLQVTEETDPVLVRSDLDRLSAATLRATVSCDQGQFVADSPRTAR